MKTTPKSLVAALGTALAVWVGAAEVAPTYHGPVEAGQLAEPKNLEASGLAASRRTPGMLWTHNDSGGEPVLFALNADGSLRGKLRLENIPNVDWEDIASFELDGRAWLLVADVGDNFGLRGGCALHLIAEPSAEELSPDRELLRPPEYSIHFIYEDGARDAEAVAVDAKERSVYVLSKREPIPRLYRLPLAPAAAAQPVTARFIGEVPHLPHPTSWQRNVRLPEYAFIGWPTAMDFSHDGTLALVLVYEEPLLFPRAAGESWAAALAREPLKLPAHHLPQAEAACFSTDDRSIFVCSERSPVLLRYDRR